MPNQDKLKELRKVIDDSNESRDSIAVLLKTARDDILAGTHDEGTLKQFLHMQELDALHADRIIEVYEQMLMILLILYAKMKEGLYA